MLEGIALDCFIDDLLGDLKQYPGEWQRGKDHQQQKDLLAARMTPDISKEARIQCALPAFWCEKPEANSHFTTPAVNPSLNSQTM
jgi:hypothetical protein